MYTQYSLNIYQRVIIHTQKLFLYNLIVFMCLQSFMQVTSVQKDCFYSDFLNFKSIEKLRKMKQGKWLNK